MAGEKKEDRRFDKDGNVLNKDGSLRKKPGAKKAEIKYDKDAKRPPITSTTRGQSKVANVGKVKNEVIQRLYEKGQSKITIVKWLMETYDYSKVHSYKVIREVRIELGEYQRKTSVDALEDAINKLEAIYEQSLANDDRRVALEVQKELNKLLQLSVERLDITTKGDKINININTNNNTNKK